MVWLPDSEKNEDMFARFDSIHECDRHTYTHRHGTAAEAPLMHSIARQKSRVFIRPRRSVEKREAASVVETSEL